MDFHLKNKRVFISGSTKGIGFATAKTLAKEGAEVIINGRTHQSVDETLKKMNEDTDISSWGRGIGKMTELCLENNQPKPIFEFEGSDFWVTFRKDIYTEEQLTKIGLNARQIKAVLFAKDKGQITNSNYQKINKISKRTVTNDLTELVEKYRLLEKKGTSGAGVFYQIIGQ